MTTFTYQTIANLTGAIVVFRSDGANIPKDLANSDYRQYLEDVTQSVADQSELDAIAKAEADAQAQADAKAKAEAQAQAIKSSAVSKLAKLGLTDEEIAALVG